MILCDTNILIEFYKGNQEILDALRRIGPAKMAVSVVTIGELYYGARDRRELTKIQNVLFASFPSPPSKGRREAAFFP
jgi:tRNA(fMet)-specific endonuclease VapC